MVKQILGFLLLTSALQLPLFAPGGGGYHEWRDDLNHYYYDETHYYDAMPIIPYEDPNSINFEFSPYLDPHFSNEIYVPEN